MGLQNISKDMMPFDMQEKPVRQFLPLAWLLWGASYLMTGRRFRAEKIGMEGLKPPFLVLSTHQGFSDYYIAPRMLFPMRANYVSDMEGFAAYGKWLYKHGGCIGKRRYVPELSVVRNIKYALETLKQPVVLFPESRHSDAGITATLPNDLGKLVKYLNVPLVILSAHGSYLANPFWDEDHTRKVSMSACLEKVYTVDEIHHLSEEEIQKTIEDKLTYDEYKWQLENKIAISYENRAQGLHKPLYKCIKCKREGVMNSEGSHLSCSACGAAWEMTEFGELEDQHTHEKLHIPDWYRWERAGVREEIEQDTYAGIDISVTIEALPNEKGFVSLGNGRLRHSKSGYILSVEGSQNEMTNALADVFPLHFASKQMQSVQTEYNYRGRGKCIVLSTANCCYYIYSSAPEFIVTKLEFATEILYEKTRRRVPADVQ